MEVEILALRRQLALYKERGLNPRRIDTATRVSLALLSKLCDWRSRLIVVRPETVARWHRAGRRLLWRYMSWPGRPPIPVELRLRLWYLPPHSPDLNPIEQAYAKIKHWTRKAQKRTIEDIWRHVGHVVAAIKPDECESYFANAGYASVK